MDRPAHCQTTEEAMIGCIVVSEGAVLSQFPFTPEHFMLWHTGAIFGAANRLRAAKKAITYSTVQAELGPEAVAKMGIANFVDYCHFPTLHTAPSLYETLCDKLTQRRAQKLGLWLIAQSQGTPDMGHLCSEAARMANELHVTSKSENVLPEAKRRIEDRIGRMDRGEKPSHRLVAPAAWNKLFGGLADGCFYGIASRPGLGKTAMMEQMVESYLLREEAVAVFEKDMSPQMLTERIACRLAGIQYWKLDREILNIEERAALRTMLDQLDPQKLLIFNPSSMTAEMMCAITRREIAGRQVRAVFLDHIQTLRFPGKDLREGLTDSSIRIRQNVTETGVPHVVLAHINREGSKGRPEPENIKEFDQLFGDVDGLALLWSEVDSADVEKGKPRPMKLYAAKNRTGGVSEESLLFDGPLLKFI